MKKQLLVRIVTVLAIGLGFTATDSRQSSAAATTFFCGTLDGTPTTVARTSRGDVPIIRWLSTYFTDAGYTPEMRCMEVSQRFQTYYQSGSLNYITTGIVNDRPVVCVAQSPGSGCKGVLFTLENSDDPDFVLHQLFNVRVRASAQPITRGENPQPEQNQLYINFNNYLNTTPAEDSISPVLESSPNKQIDGVNNTTSTLGERIQTLNSAQTVTEIERSWDRDYKNYFKANLSDRSLGAAEIAETLDKLATQTGKRPALIYAVPTPGKLELVLVLPQKQPIRKAIAEAKQQALVNTVKQFNREITDVTQLNSTSYLPPAQQLYRWIIAPLDAELEANKIDTIIFCMGPNLRSVPLAALHDGQKFLVEKYSIGLIPAFNMTDTLYRDLKNSPILAMGASLFKEQAPLAAVPVELSAITQDISGVLWPASWQGKTFLNQEFTVDNLRVQRAAQPFGIVHLATHAEFRSGAPENSYIQFWDSKLTLDKMRQLQWNNPPVELLVLSACRTAVGDKDAEMGFAGLAVNSGVKSALASLWSVSDLGTLGLMTEFYQQLRLAPIKAEALRQAQINMLRGEVRLQDGKLQGPMLGEGVSLPPKLAAFGNTDFKHPFYWAAFTMVGSPW